MIHRLHPSIHPESAGDGRDWEKYCAQSYKKVEGMCLLYLTNPKCVNYGLVLGYRGAVGLSSYGLYGGDSYTSQDYKLKIGVDIVVGTPDRIKCGEAGHNSVGCPKFPKEKKNQKSKEIDEAGASPSQPSQAPETLTFSQGPFTQESNI